MLSETEVINHSKHMKKYRMLIIIPVIIITAFTTALIMPSSHTTFNDHGDVWHTIEEGEFKVQWRHIQGVDDTMAVVHIHQNDTLYTWIGKPCQCY